MEYLLLVTLIGIGVIAGLASVRCALVNELNDLARAINCINIGDRCTHVGCRHKWGSHDGWSHQGDSHEWDSHEGGSHE